MTFTFKSPPYELLIAIITIFVVMGVGLYVLSTITAEKICKINYEGDLVTYNCKNLPYLEKSPHCFNTSRIEEWCVLPNGTEIKELYGNITSVS